MKTNNLSKHSFKAVILASLKDIEEHYPWTRTVFYFLVWLYGITPIWKVSIAIVALIIYFHFDRKWEETAIQMQSRMSKALTTKMEATAQPYKGLEAFLLSSLNDSDRNLKPSEGLQKKIQTIEEQIENPSQASKNSESTTPAIEIKSGESGRDYYITATNSESFLFAPSLSLGPQLLSELSSSPTLHTIRKHYPRLAQDIAVAFKVGQLLKKLDFQQIGDRLIAQSYFISDTGVLAIRESGVSHQSKYYHGQFKPTMFVPERPYFSKTVSADTHERFFGYASEPYFDLAGNGLVQTFCKKAGSSNVYVLCFDTQIPGDSLKMFLDSIPAAYNEISCEVLPDHQTCTIPQSLEARLHWITHAVKQYSATKEGPNIFAEIAIKDSHLLKAEASTLEFTIPLHTHLENDKRTTTLLWASIDLGQLKQTSVDQATWSRFGLFVFAVMLISLVWDYRLRMKQEEDVLWVVSKVLKEAGTPFAWFDEKNHFVTANDHFIKLFGYDNFEDLCKKSDTEKRTFKELLTPMSQKKYEEILDKSKHGEKSSPYIVDVTTKSGSILTITVHADRVPFPRLLLRDLPHRFGVILKWRMHKETGK